jgi:hypothetical protein
MRKARCENICFEGLEKLALSQRLPLYRIAVLHSVTRQRPVVKIT